MQDHLQERFRENPDLLHYMRKHPHWYRRLMREPEAIAQMEKEARSYYGRSWDKRVERIGSQLGMLKVLASLAKEMGKE